MKMIKPIKKKELPTVYSLEQVSELLQVSERTVMREIARGSLKSFKVGKSLRFTLEAIETYIENQKIEPYAVAEDEEEPGVS